MVAKFYCDHCGAELGPSERGWMDPYRASLELYGPPPSPPPQDESTAYHSAMRVRTTRMGEYCSEACRRAAVAKWIGPDPPTPLKHACSNDLCEICEADVRHERKVFE